MQPELGRSRPDADVGVSGRAIYSVDASKHYGIVLRNGSTGPDRRGITDG